MTQPIDRDTELLRTAVSVLAGLIVATEHVDHAEIANQVGRLLNAVCKYNAAAAERVSDEPLRAAVARLSSLNDP